MIKVFKLKLVTKLSMESSNLELCPCQSQSKRFIISGLRIPLDWTIARPHFFSLQGGKGGGGISKYTFFKLNEIERTWNGPPCCRETSVVDAFVTDEFHPEPPGGGFDGRCGCGVTSFKS